MELKMDHPLQIARITKNLEKEALTKNFGQTSIFNKWNVILHIRNHLVKFSDSKKTSRNSEETAW